MTATMPVYRRREAVRADRIRRRELPGAITGRLLFAQVREDPMLEIDALRPRKSGRYAVVGSGGCTALSLLAAGAGHVAAVDLNSAQNHLTELKATALGLVSPWEYSGFIGAEPMSHARRRGVYAGVKPMLSPAAGRYWDLNEDLISAGVLGAGVSEKFIRALAFALRTFVHPRDRIERLLSCTTLEEQRTLYESEWNTRRWRGLFEVLVNRWTFNRTYDPAFFANSGNKSFAKHFHRLFERTVCDVPVATNYFLHHMLTGKYPAGTAGGVPPYIDMSWGPSLEEVSSGLELIDGRYEDYLSQCNAGSVDGFALSNICEWMDDFSIEALFEEVVRVAKPGAYVCFRNFVGHTEVPEKLRDRVRENRDAGRRAIFSDRSCVQARIAICRVEK